MKRPNKIANRIRYYGWAMTEMTAQAYDLGIQAGYQWMPLSSGMNLTVYFWEGSKILHQFTAMLDDDQELDRLEANVEAVMTLKEDGVEV
jgi:hypothetical protein